MLEFDMKLKLDLHTVYTVCVHKKFKDSEVKNFIWSLLFVSVYVFSDLASQRSPPMVITTRHNQPILPTGFEGDFLLTLGFCFLTFSFSPFWYICHFEGSAEQLLEMLLG